MSTSLYDTKLDEQFIETNNVLENEEGRLGNVFYTPKAKSTLNPEQLKAFYEHLFTVANKLKMR